ncbi:GNAT family N-acetyltransferase [Candidatus Manganitrophus noduliformans]|uniref:GNAT family N-acetyltransferase n=1 Tax=Candidatus Manganitrophus noduliformans TaxID=2606439 RepID=A0A7X6DQV4_9BACT|nr:GNAT family N-acetyltransferase [Candidatus Manganitrophus noduliformans]NKE71654.1 GNAT family N-acetyltransferase [Candidatus Manganitrophus noduliformans]
MKIRPAVIDDAPAISALVSALAREFIVPDFTEAAAKRLLEEMDTASIRKYIASGCRYHVAEEGGKIIGAVAVKENGHLFHLFVSKDFQGRGIARALWETAKGASLAAGNPRRFTVNASLAAVGVYEKLGFVRQSEPVRKSGIVYVPMMLDLRVGRKDERLHIRDAKESDREAIREVTLAAFQEYAAQMPVHWEGYRQGISATLANVEPAEQIVAEREGMIVGAILLYPAGSVYSPPNNPPMTRAWPEMRLLAVAPAARGSGIGAALVRECIRRARRSGSQALTLHTSDVMRVAMRMYERMGFVRDPELDFRLSEAVTVKGYRFNLDVPTSEAGIAD